MVIVKNIDNGRDMMELWFGKVYKKYKREWIIKKIGNIFIK
jgi:hypothetical protein